MPPQDSAYPDSGQVRALQLEQHNARTALYEAWNNAQVETALSDFEAAKRCPVFVRARQAYEAAVSRLEALLGPKPTVRTSTATSSGCTPTCTRTTTGFGRDTTSREPKCRNT